MYNEIFKKIYDEASNIRNLSYHLNIYKTSVVNPIAIYDKIREYQKNIFCEKSTIDIEKLDDERMQIIESGIPCLTICNKNGSLFIYNKFVKYLDDKYIEIGKMAYFDKNYNG